jgi:DNA-binding NarL/FixJ family response regulator
MPGIRVLLADDHTVVRQGLAGILAAGGCEVVAQASDGAEAVELALRLNPAVVVLDLAMPRLNGLEATRRIRAALPRARVLVLTAQDEVEFVVPLVRAGAHGFLRKDCAATELLAGVRALAAGDSYFGPAASRVLVEQLAAGEPPDDPLGRLTDREREVFQLAVEGKTIKQVAALLGISAKTAENHRSRMLQKLGLHGTAELVRFAARHGWVR